MWIAALSRLTVFDRKDTESPQLDPVATGQRLRQRGEDFMNDGLGLSVHEVMSVRHGGTELAFRHRVAIALWSDRKKPLGRRVDASAVPGYREKREGKSTVNRSPWEGGGNIIKKALRHNKKALDLVSRANDAVVHKTTMRTGLTLSEQQRLDGEVFSRMVVVLVRI